MNNMVRCVEEDCVKKIDKNGEGGREALGMGNREALGMGNCSINI